MENLKFLRILHFSDFHLDGAKEKDSENLIFHMLKALKELDAPIDLIVFTGDMISKGGEGYDGQNRIGSAFSGFQRIVIEKMCSDLSIGKDRFIFIPGNHDIDRNADDLEMVEDSIEKKTTSEESLAQYIKSEKSKNYSQRVSKFKDFEYNYYKDLYNSNYQSSHFQSNFKITIKGLKVGITSLNSVWRCGQDDEKKIVIGLCQINDSQQFLDGCEVKIAASHYRYDKLKEFEVDPIKRKLAECYDIFFSGHTHSGFISFTDIDTGHSFLDMNTAGSLSANEYVQDEKHKNAFQIVDYFPGIKVVTREYIQNDGGAFIINKRKGENGVWTKTIPSPQEAANSAKIENERIERQKELQREQELFPIMPIKKAYEKLRHGLFVLPFETNERIQKIKADLLDDTKHNIRFMALSGMGKTRIIMDTFCNPLKENVFYSSSSNLDEPLIRLLETQSECTLIVDNCLNTDVAKIRRIITESGKNVKLITVHNVMTPDEMRTDGVLLTLNYNDGEEIVEKILLRNRLQEENPRVVDLIKERSGNIPYMVQLLIRAYRNNNNLVIENRNMVLETLLKGSGKLDDKESKVLKAISLFDPLGAEDGIKDEIDFVRTNSSIHHIAENQEIVNLLFKDTIEDYIRRQLIETGGDCIRIRPRPLAEWLTENWLENYGNYMPDVLDSIQKQEKGLARRLFRAIKKRIIGLNDSPYAQDLVDKLNNTTNGFFHDERIAFSETGSQLFLSMGEVSPVAVSKNLLSLLNVKSYDWISEHIQGELRRNLVWSLENTSMNEHAFENSALALAKLALSENEDYGNNATGIFLQLYHVFLSGTKADLKKRVSVLYQLEEKEEFFPLIMKAISSAYISRGFSRIGSFDKKSIDTVAPDYRPTVSEIHEYWNDCSAILKSIYEQDNSLLSSIAELIPSHVYDFCHLEAFTNLSDLLNYFAPKLSYDWILMRDALSMYRYKWSNGKREGIILADEWLQKLTPAFFSERIASAVKDFRNKTPYSSIDYDNQMREEMMPFAYEFINEQVFLTDQMLSLIKGQINGLHWFVQDLSKIVKANGNSKLILDAISKSLESIEKNFYSSFIILLCNNLREDASLVCFRNDIYNKGFYSMAAAIDGMIDDKSFKRFIDLIRLTKDEIIDEQCLISYLNQHHFYSADSVFDLADLMLKEGVDQYKVIYPFVLDRPIFQDVKARQDIEGMKRYQKLLLDYHYKENYNALNIQVVDSISHVLAETDVPQFAKHVNLRLIEIISEEKLTDNPFNHIYFQLLPKYQKVILVDLLEVLAAEDYRQRFYVMMYLHLGSGFGHGCGPLFQCNQEMIKKSCMKYSNVLPERLATMCPVFNYDKEGEKTGFSNFFLWLCDNFGNQKRVLNGLSANIDTYSWSGIGGFYHMYEERLPFIKPLLQHKYETVREWANKLLLQTKNNIEYEKGKEDYEQMILN